MEYFALTNTEFFKRINENNTNNDITVAYRDFIQQIFSFYKDNRNMQELFFVLAYTEVELQSLSEYRQLDPVEDTKTELSQNFLFLHKSLIFIRHILKDLQAQMQFSVSPVSAVNNQQSPVSAFKWTGSVVELVEIIYGFIEMKSVNHGETPITELANFISEQFGVEIKDCYSAYVDMKHRKNNSRTYYLDKMRERLNRRMELDDERERM